MPRANNYFRELRRGTVTVESIYRDRELRAAFLAPAPLVQCEAPPAPGEDLSLMQRLALLGMMNSTLARGAAKKLASNEGVQDKPSIVDYHVLREQGLAEKLDGHQYHELTYAGMQVAKRVLSRICSDLDIHIMQPGTVDGDGKDARTYYRCSCGGWGRSFRGNGQFAWRRAQNAFYQHYNPQARGVES